MSNGLWVSQEVLNSKRLMVLVRLGVRTIEEVVVEDGARRNVAHMSRFGEGNLLLIYLLTL